MGFEISATLADVYSLRLGGKKEGAGVAVAVMLAGIMDIEYDLDLR
jgi:hypothetical protein